MQQHTEKRKMENERMSKHSEGNYKRFMAMVGTSTAIMFGLMYLNTYELGHVYWSETRFWMTFVMGAVMAVVMLLFMWGMYKNAGKNWTIIITAIAVFTGGLYLVRSQDTVYDSEWMSAMIPHHSIAIMTSERANISDVRVRKLADNIIKAQRREIKEMEWLIDDIAANGKAETEADAAARPVPPYEGELRPVDRR